LDTQKPVILVGSKQIAAHLFGEDTPLTRRRVHHWRSQKWIKTFKRGNALCAYVADLDTTLVPEVLP